MKKLRPCGTEWEGKLQNQGDTRTNGGLRTVKLLHYGKLAALHVVSAHDGDDGRVLAIGTANMLDLSCVTQMKGVIFRDDGNGFHISPPFFGKK